MGVINKIPDGFLDFLKAKTGGRNPTVLSDSVVPTIDMTQFYLGREMAQVNYTTTTTSNGSTSSIVVPAGETWLLFSAGFKFNQTDGVDRVYFDFELSRIPDSLSQFERIQLFSNFTESGTVTSLGAIGQASHAKTWLPMIPIPPGILVSTTVTLSNQAVGTLLTNLGIFRLIS